MRSTHRSMHRSVAFSPAPRRPRWSLCARPCSSNTRWAIISSMWIHLAGCLVGCRQHSPRSALHAVRFKRTFEPVDCHSRLRCHQHEHNRRYGRADHSKHAITLINACNKTPAPQSKQHTNSSPARHFQIKSWQCSIYQKQSAFNINENWLPQHARCLCGWLIYQWSREFVVSD